MYDHGTSKFTPITGYLLLGILFLFTTGCAGLNPKAMIPDVKANHLVQINKSVRVVEVTGGKTPQFGDGHFVPNEPLREALVLTLTSSNIFRKVQTDGDSDLILKANVLSQGRTSGNSANYRHEITIHYQFAERDTNKIVWQDTYQTEAGSAAFSGAAKTAEACEGSVRESLALLLQGINERWPVNAR